MWKTRLRNTIDTGKLEIPVATIRVDNQCEFGKWLYGASIDPLQKLSEHYKKVKELHAGFHKAAAGVAELIVAGKKAMRKIMMGLAGEYTLASEKPAKAMMEWHNSNSH